MSQDTFVAELPLDKFTDKKVRFAVPDGGPDVAVSSTYVRQTFLVEAAKATGNLGKTPTSVTVIVQVNW